MNPLKSVRKTLKNTIVHANKTMGNYNKTIWIVGDGRSGTSWLADLLNYRKQYLYLFEPLHPYVFPFLTFEEPWLFLQAGQTDNHQQEIAEIFSLTTRGSHVRVGWPFLHKGAVIKDIHGHLMMEWVARRFPQIKQVLLLRHPFAVALSKSKLKSWRWMEEPKLFLTNQALNERYLSPFKDVILSGENYFENQVIIWCIVHYIALKQAAENHTDVIYYEHLCIDYKDELLPLLEYFGDSKGVDDQRLLALINKPSSTSAKHSAVKKHKNKTTGWQNELSAKQITTGENILREFAMHQIYPSGESLADKQAVKAFIKPRV